MTNKKSHYQAQKILKSLKIKKEFSRLFYFLEGSVNQIVDGFNTHAENLKYFDNYLKLIEDDIRELRKKLEKKISGN